MISVHSRLRAALPAAWYDAERKSFLRTHAREIADRLAGRATEESLSIESEQFEEWQQSVGLLQSSLGDRIVEVQEALASVECEEIRHVILEFDFRRRGLRMDCVLLGDGILFVIEFKRSVLTSADRDQVMNYAVNLWEFHSATREWCAQGGAIIVPVLSTTKAKRQTPVPWPGFNSSSWPSLARRPLECDRDSLREALLSGLTHRRSTTSIDPRVWLASKFQPSSSILDAAISLYGNHDVAAIEEHAAPREEIERSTAEIRSLVEDALIRGRRLVILLSGAPGAGKTLVGLDLALRGKTANESVFVTGNAPLVDVLNAALERSYRRLASKKSTWTPAGYRREDARLVAGAATFKLVKAHNFLGNRGRPHGQADGRVVIFDEAQRTYAKDRIVLRAKLSDHEADLILEAQQREFPTGGSVVVALVGQNQAINRGERGVVAWFEAAERKGWEFAVSDRTLELPELGDGRYWSAHENRRRVEHGHLKQSMRFYRNATIETWAHALLTERVGEARVLAEAAAENGIVIELTRDLGVARAWARRSTIGSQRCGIIASGQAKRLAADGLFVDYKPSIADWMLAPSSDCRSSNALEVVQNQYQIQGLELDYCIVAWDVDLRRERGRWSAYRLSGAQWKRDGDLDVAKNGYRVLLTRARKGMMIFVPRGADAADDPTRRAEDYDGIAEVLLAAGARLAGERAPSAG